MSIVRYSQFVPAFSAAACQHLLSVSRLHTLTKTVNRLPAAFMRLKCTFHILLIYAFCKGSAKVTQYLYFNKYFATKQSKRATPPNFVAQYPKNQQHCYHIIE
jgi:hypothetical protein